MIHIRRRLISRVAGVLTASLVSFVLFAPTVFAQSQGTQGGFNMSSSPVFVDLEVKPGQSVTTKVQVKNNGNATEHVKVGILKFSSNNTDGSPKLLDPEQNDEFLTWVKFSESTFDAEPNVWKSIDVTIAPPSTAAFGYYYAVTFSRNNQGASQPNTANILGSIAVPILLDVQAPGAVRKADITEFTVNKNMFEFLPAKFNVTLKNSGNVHVAPRGNIFITKGGKNVSLLEVNQGKGNILPNSNRQFSADWEDGSPVYKLKEENGKTVLDRENKPVSFLDWSKFDPSKVRFGKYHAKIAMVYDDGHSDISTEAELDFWVIPWRIIGFLVVAILLLGAGLWAILIRPIRKGIKKLPSKKKRSTKTESTE